MNDAKTTARPFFALYVVWHPSNASGGKIADLLHRHFGPNLHRNIAGDTGVSVIYRNKEAPGERAPLSINWDEAETTAVVVLVDSTLADDTDWSNYVGKLSEETQKQERELSSCLFPIVLEPGGLELQFEEQALRWDNWEESDAIREQKLVNDLTYAFIRMLRQWLHGPEATLADYLKKIQVFISHSKHDDEGEPIARSIRNWLHEHSALASFFDVHDIPAGLSFQKVLLQNIQSSIFMAVHTDTYSSREWCRREVVEAKRRHVPMIIVDCLSDIDQRSIPYMGNVPIVRMGSNLDRICTVIGCLLEEVFRDYIWRCRIESYREDFPDVLFTTRPPELILLATLSDHQSGNVSKIVYPEPLLGTDEARLLSKIEPTVPTLTLTEWMEENP